MSEAVNDPAQVQEAESTAMVANPHWYSSKGQASCIRKISTRRKCNKDRNIFLYFCGTASCVTTNHWCVGFFAPKDFM